MSLQLAEIEAGLQHALARPLPGPVAQRLMAPQPRPGWDPDRAPPPGRPAAVLVLFYPAPAAEPRQPTAPKTREPCVLLTARTEALQAHRGQIAYPGGGIEPGETPEETALREAWEEVGLDPARARVLGRLSALWVPATGFTIQPILAIAERRPPLRANAREVARIIESPVRELGDPQRVRLAAGDPDRRWVRAPFFDLRGAKLWGASAMITAEWLRMLGWPGPPEQIPPAPL
ncbi:MAG: NUDIX domain-containing protein [Candidatus Eisenbacteria bacterium]|nr:NUDIX domain-containing protein [Candidatus Eisenbacteria bacterium]